MRFIVLNCSQFTQSSPPLYTVVSFFLASAGTLPKTKGLAIHVFVLAFFRATLGSVLGVALPSRLSRRSLGRRLDLVEVDCLAATLQRTVLVRILIQNPRVASIGPWAISSEATGYERQKKKGKGPLAESIF